MSLPQPPRDPRARRLTVLPPLSTPRTVPGAAWQALRHSVQQWAVGSQRTACRNAMVAGTALAARRAERKDVEEFLAARQQPALEVSPESLAPPAAEHPAPGRSAHG